MAKNYLQAKMYILSHFVYINNINKIGRKGFFSHVNHTPILSLIVHYSKGNWIIKIFPFVACQIFFLPQKGLLTFKKKDFKKLARNIGLDYLEKM